MIIVLVIQPFAGLTEWSPQTFRHLGAYATSAAGGSQRIAWRGCTFQDVSAGSHMLGDITNAVLNNTDPSDWDRDLLVEDCTIANIPVEYTGATGLFAGYGESDGSSETCARLQSR